jgi:hypothetical protein
MKATFKIPVVYTAKAARGRADSHVVGVVDHEVELREVHEDDAPLAIRAELVNPIFDRADYRLHSGRLHSLVFSNRRSEFGAPSGRIQGIRAAIWQQAFDHVKTLRGNITPPKASFIPLPKGCSWEDMENILIEGTRAFVPTPEQRLQVLEWRRRADEEAAKNIVVNNRCYAQTSEPRYVVELSGPRRIGFSLAHRHDPYASILQIYRTDKIKRTDRVQFAAYFNVDQEAQAVELFEQRKKQGLEDVQHAARFERILDEYRCDDIEAMEIDRFARILLNDVSWGLSSRSRTRPMILEDGVDELVDALISLKAMVVDRDSSTGVDDNLDTAMDLVIANANGGNRTRPYLSDHVRDACNLAIDRWRSRPIPVNAPGFRLR